ncbi:isoleucine--tRNA ligase [Segniliparus rotundus]|nr:isoleucine--tRNA ligase [Segniliparus rotundus]
MRETESSAVGLASVPSTGAERAPAYPKTDLTSGAGAAEFPAFEQAVLDFWDADDTFAASLAAREGEAEYVFYEGPPFANGLPHYGHLLTGYVKDLIPRFQTMRGKRVDRRFGWDCHGLPAEMEAEKQLGITDKSQIETMGLDTFNEYCRESVLKYSLEWRRYVRRQARWVDFEQDYRTLDLSYMESVMWAFKQLYDKGLIYKGYRVGPYSWYEQTPLSALEARLDDSYRMRQDPAVTVAMPLVCDGPLSGARALIWTTTPWTLPSNLAIAVHPETRYTHVRGQDGERYLLAEARVGHYARELGDEPEVLSTHTGSELVGLAYTPPFTFFRDWPNSFRVLAADYVTTESGTGVVHLAPAFGEEDFEFAKSQGIEPVQPLDPGGKFTSLVPPYEGMQVFDANPVVIKDLKAAGLLLRHETIEHSYPHSWRSGKPLIYMAVEAWYVKVADFRDRMVELNKSLAWNPEHIRDGQFGKWLEGARDWNISRNRYWGSPVPVWVSDDPAYPRTDVYGSLDELERDFGVRPTDLHRPMIDELTRPNPDDPTGRSTMRRVPEVLDCWFESGSMPYAQAHYPFENQDWFSSHYPADFLVEYNGQTRGWFYSLHVLATALFDSPAFTRGIAHGIILGDDGQKMSKSKGNYPDIQEVFDRDGADAMRWYLMASPILRGGNLVVSQQGIRDGVRQALLPLWNTYSFLRLYAFESGQWRTDSTHVLDRYILARLRQTVETMTESLEGLDVACACEAFRDFCEVLTNWYVRRSRERFWSEDAAAINTLHTVLEVACRLAAPLLPLVSEVIWKGLTGQRSVHLADWPDASSLPGDPELVAAMDRVREVCAAGLSLRKATGLRVRQPLRSLTVAGPGAEFLAPYAALVQAEVNVDEVLLTPDVAEHGRWEVAVNARAAGPRLGGAVQQAIKAVKAGDWTANAENIAAGGVELLPSEFTRTLVPSAADRTQAIGSGEAQGLVVLDTELDEALQSRGWAADRIRELQNQRKELGFDVSDRVKVAFTVPEDAHAWALRHQAWIAKEILAVEFDVRSGARVHSEMSKA